jgi:hypothetical protein
MSKEVNTILFSIWITNCGEFDVIHSTEFFLCERLIIISLANTAGLCFHVIFHIVLFFTSLSSDGQLPEVMFIFMLKTNLIVRIVYWIRHLSFTCLYDKQILSIKSLSTKWITKEIFKWYQLIMILLIGFFFLAGFSNEI